MGKNKQKNTSNRTIQVEDFTEILVKVQYRLELERELCKKMISLSNRIVFDISSRLSCVVLNTTPYASKASISTSNFLKAQDPGIPKRPSTAFLRFANEVRPEISKKNPNLKMV